MRGGTHKATPKAEISQGLSPRARGNPKIGGLGIAMCGTIPACAGEPSDSDVADQSSRDYPRVRGGTGAATILAASYLGLSPRARGNQCHFLHHVDVSGTIPACAGEPTLIPALMCVRRDYPRVRGGTLLLADDWVRLTGLSPRARGNPSQRSDADA